MATPYNDITWHQQLHFGITYRPSNHFWKGIEALYDGLGNKNIWHFGLFGGVGMWFWWARS
jgi:hypothetical protein